MGANLWHLSPTDGFYFVFSYLKKTYQLGSQSPATAKIPSKATQRSRKIATFNSSMHASSSSICWHSESVLASTQTRPLPEPRASIGLQKFPAIGSRTRIHPLSTRETDLRTTTRDHWPFRERKARFTMWFMAV